MIEKTFVEEPLANPLNAESNKRQDNIRVRSYALQEKRNRVVNYLAVSLNVDKNEVKIEEGLDVWEANRGRYSGEAEVRKTRYSFVAQSYASGDKVLTHFIVEKQ